ncbi:MAG: methyl-accepting chemotaxis protein [Gammaproteobacteria bacterium]|nr:methyl-accepting chemotaxis protein [Gammaproteobacteria bacterium]
MTTATLPAFLSARNLPALVGVATALLAVAVLGVLLSVLPGGSASGGGARPLLDAIAADAPWVAQGDRAALERLLQNASELQQRVTRESQAAWARDARLPKVLSDIDLIRDSGTALVDAKTARERANALVPRLRQVFAELSKGLPAASADTATRMLDRVEARSLQMQLDLAELIANADRPAVVAQRLGENFDYLAQALRSLRGQDSTFGPLPRLAGNDVPQLLATGQRSLQELDAAVRSAVAAVPQLAAAHRAALDVAANARELAAIAARSDGGHAPIGLRWWPAIPAMLAIVPLALLWQRARELKADADHQRLASALQRQQVDKNQEAILRLLDEMSSLADGDLTVQATVTEDMTGAIADSFNYAVDALRGLVTTINQSALKLDSATRQTQALAQHLAKASTAQSRQIAQASESVAEMAASTEEVSGNAERAADVARHSVDVAHKGGDAVRRTIDGMNAIRETIQETSKRIKRLGESSQEIGNIVELINDIAEQTNILALNASIQASMAGEAGRGFAVVADEVQRLAERAANATKQIEVLVRTIQADTNEAVVSMERSTTDVVGGALLAENAGAALDEIEQVSNQIASLVQNISASARQQAGSAQAMARNMSVLKEISVQTAESTSATSQQIAKLAELSAELRKSIAGFRLPGVNQSV